MPLAKFYRINNVWHLDQYDALPSGCWSRTFNDIGQIVISLLPPYSPSPNGNMYATGYYSDFCDASGTAYATQDAFDEATNDFFIKDSTISGYRDDGSTAYQNFDNKDRLNVDSQPYLYAIAEGSVGGHNPMLKFGIRSSIAAGTISTIWEGTAASYQYLAAASTLSIVSSSTADSSSGTGARSVTVYGLDASFNEQYETISTNGTSAVTTTKHFIRVFRVSAEICGSSATNVGAINITSTTGAIQLAIIPAVDGESCASIWTVPVGKVAYITQMTLSNDSGKGARFALLTRQMDGGELYPWKVKYRGYILGGINNLPFNIPFRIPAKTDIELRFLTDANAGTTRGGGSFELWYEDVE